MTRYLGSCHCGAVTFEITAPITEVYTCDCSLCRRKNALMTQVHESALYILSGADKLTLYRWNLKIAKHYFCSVCGIYPFHRKRSAPDHYGVNVMCLEDFDPEGLPVRRGDGKGMSLARDASSRWPGPID
ncbi:MAG: GFA family protein [Hyphomonadaceae bacterium]